MTSRYLCRACRNEPTHMVRRMRDTGEIRDTFTLCYYHLRGCLPFPPRWHVTPVFAMPSFADPTGAWT